MTTIMGQWIETKKQLPDSGPVWLFGCAKWSNWFNPVRGYWDGKRWRYADNRKVIRTRVTHWWLDDVPVNDEEQEVEVV